MWNRDFDSDLEIRKDPISMWLISFNDARFLDVTVRTLAGLTRLPPVQLGTQLARFNWTRLMTFNQGHRRQLRR